VFVLPAASRAVTVMTLAPGFSAARAPTTLSYRMPVAAAAPVAGPLTPASRQRRRDAVPA
jgi:hypothetical protein